RRETREEVLAEDRREIERDGGDGNVALRAFACSRRTASQLHPTYARRSIRRRCQACAERIARGLEAPANRPNFVEQGRHDFIFRGFALMTLPNDAQRFVQELDFSE